MFERQQHRLSHHRPRGSWQGGDYVRGMVTVPEQEPKQGYPDVRTRDWLRGVDPSEQRVEVRAPARVILLPNDVEGRRDRLRRRPAERVDQALVEFRGAQVGKGV